jgi:hypothetical protein
MPAIPSTQSPWNGDDFLRCQEDELRVVRTSRSKAFLDFGRVGLMFGVAAFSIHASACVAVFCWDGIDVHIIREHMI